MKPTAFTPPLSAKLFLIVTLSLTGVAFKLNSAEARPSIAGQSCSIEGAVVKVKKTAFTCLRKGKQLRWTVNTGSARATTASTTTTTAKRPFGYPFVMPSQYSSKEFLADVFVSSQSVKRGQSINILVKLSFAGYGQTYRLDESSTLEEIINKCRSLIGVGTDVNPPTQAWSPNVVVSLRGTTVTGGGSTQLVIIGDVIQDCGTSLVKTNPPHIALERWALYQDIGIRLEIPTTLASGTYDLLLNQIGNPWTKSTPIKITVTD